MIPVQVKVGSKAVGTQALFDTGADGSFVNRRFINKHGIKQQALGRPITVQNVDGTKNKDGQITSTVQLPLLIGEQAQTE